MEDKTINTLKAVVDKMKADKLAKEDAKKKYKDKEKTKKLTDKERLDRIEEILGI